MAEENSTTSTNGFREDLLKLAASFLSSSKVQAAEKSKKVAFLKSKGLTDDEIVEAFRRLDQQGATVPTLTETTASQGTLTDSTTKPTMQPSSFSPGLNFTPPSTALISERPLEPLILYHPAPTAPKVPSRQVFALAVILGVGVTGVACGMVGIVKVSLKQVKLYLLGPYNILIFLFDSDYCIRYLLLMQVTSTADINITPPWLKSCK